LANELDFLFVGGNNSERHLPCNIILKKGERREVMSEMKRVPREKNFGQLRNYAFDKNTPPVVEVECGESFAAETQDSCNGVLREDPTKLFPRDVRPYTERVPVWLNPLCGPIYIKGVEAGDVVVVTLHKIDKILDGDTVTVPGAHHFAGLRGWEDCDQMYTGIIKHEGRKAAWKYGSRVYTWDLRPFIGTIATAPEWEVLSSVPTSFGSAAACGGNMDCRDVREGAKIYLQSYNEGGLLFFGDVHGSQGDGEVSGAANEVAVEITLSCDVIKNKTLNNVRLETPESLISVYCYRPVEEGIRRALMDLILWLEEDYGMSKREAYVLASVYPDFRINVYQVCGGLGFGRLMTTVGAEFPKKILPK
jgi:amidase